MIRIGAATKWSEFIAADLPKAFDALKLSAREVGSIQVQNSGTIGGNLCNASPAADGVPPLLILDAEVELTSLRGTRHLPLHTFITGNRRTEIGDDEVLSRVTIEDNHVESAAIAIGSCSEVAQRLTDLEAALIGCSVNDLRIQTDLIEAALSPIADIRSDAEYRLKAASALVHRALREATQ